MENNKKGENDAELLHVGVKKDYFRSGFKTGFGIHFNEIQNVRISYKMFPACVCGFDEASVESDFFGYERTYIRQVICIENNAKDTVLINVGRKRESAALYWPPFSVAIRSCFALYEWNAAMPAFRELIFLCDYKTPLEPGIILFGEYFFFSGKEVEPHVRAGVFVTWCAVFPVVRSEIARTAGGTAKCPAVEIYRRDPVEKTVYC